MRSEHSHAQSLPVLQIQKVHSSRNESIRYEWNIYINKKKNYSFKTFFRPFEGKFYVTSFVVLIGSVLPAKITVLDQNLSHNI